MVRPFTQKRRFLATGPSAAGWEAGALNVLGKKSVKIIRKGKLGGEQKRTVSDAHNGEGKKGLIGEQKALNSTLA